MRYSEDDLFVCECGDVCHQFVISHFKDDDEIFVAVKLTRGRFFERIWHAFKYIFGLPCKYGDFEEVILGDEEIKRLAGILNNKIKENEERKNSKL